MLAEGINNPWHGQLLRLRKDLPHIVDTETAHSGFVSLIHPLFSDKNIIHQRLVAFNCHDGWIGRLNEELRRSESGNLKELPAQYPARPTKRRGVYLADDRYGLLITDMTALGPCSRTIEFKPKWLAQSPSAPRGSLRCRSCARRAQIHDNSGRGPRFCPLSLLEDSRAIVKRAAENIISSAVKTGELEDCMVDRLTTFLLDSGEAKFVLNTLRSYQLALDATGIMDTLEDPDEDNPKFMSELIATKFCAAMTLRDCNIYIRFPESGAGSPEIRVGDLDLKSVRKAAYWVSVDKPLIEEGWYEGKDAKGKSNVDYEFFRGKAASRKRDHVPLREETEISETGKSISLSNTIRRLPLTLRRVTSNMPNLLKQPRSPSNSSPATENAPGKNENALNQAWEVSDPREVPKDELELDQREADERKANERKKRREEHLNKLRKPFRNVFIRNKKRMPNPTPERLQVIEQKWAQMNAAALDCFENPEYRKLMLELEVKDGGILSQQGIAVADGVVQDPDGLELALCEAMETSMASDDDDDDDDALNDSVSCEDNENTYNVEEMAFWEEEAREECVRFFEGLVEERMQDIRERQRRRGERAEREAEQIRGWMETSGVVVPNPEGGGGGGKQRKWKCWEEEDEDEEDDSDDGSQRRW